MSGVKHTPGPWSVSVVNSVVCVQARDEIGQPFDICAMSNFDMEANARLIAAAPDLLEAGQNVVEEWGMRTGDDDALLPSSEQPESIAALMRAIARARGES